MNKSFFLTFLAFLLALSSKTFGQDSQTEARILYIQAEELLNENYYSEALNKLSTSEDLLGKTTPKILYLKIQIYDRIIIQDWSQSTKMQTAISTFFEIVDKSTYPSDKYLEIAEISLKLKEKAKLYESTYLKLKEGNDYAGYKLFSTNFPNSEYLKILSAVYNESIISENENQKKLLLREKVKKVELDYSPLITKRKKQTTLCLSLTATYAVVGSVCMAIDYARLQNSASYAESRLFKIFGISFLGISSIPAICSIGYGASWGGLVAKRNKEINKLEVLLPTYDVYNNSIQAHLRISF